MNMMRIWLIISCIYLFNNSLSAQDTSTYLIGFYNVENLFNPNDDSLKNDDAFTPTGSYHWTYKKYVKKINNIAKVILAMNDWSPPDIIGLAEIEEESVLRKMCHDSPLNKYRYRYVHYDSPDVRGVDVALIYRSDRVRIIRSKPVPIVFPFDTAAKNRDLLYAVAQFSCGDSLHIIVNHWTSRFGGYAPTINKRNYYASVVRKMTDSIMLENPSANILIMGDFNDYCTDESISDVLRAGDLDNPEHADYQLFDLMFRLLKLENVGSHKHEDFWGCLDQMIVSRALLDGQNPLSIVNREADVFVSDFMVEPDEKFGGFKVFRTFLGPRYLGGYADHLPVYLRIRQGIGGG